MEKARQHLLLRDKLSEQNRSQELSKLDKDTFNRHRRRTDDTAELSHKERLRSRSDLEKSTDDLQNVLDPSTALVVKCLKLMLGSRTASRARLLSPVRRVLFSVINYWPSVNTARP